MTTETRQDARRTGVRVLVGSTGAALVAGASVAAAGLVVDGSAGLLAGLIGTGTVVAVLFSGALVVTVVADLMPSASLMVALMTYTLQVVLLAVVLVALGDSSWAARNLAGAWLAGAVIAGALVWTFAQVLLAVRTRIPVYDLAPTDARRGGAGLAEGGA